MILTNQPLYPARIDYAGLGKGVRILFNPAVGAVDLVTGNMWTPGGNASVATGEKGSNFSFDGVDDYYAYAGYPELTGNIGTFLSGVPRSARQILTGMYFSAPLRQAFRAIRYTPPWEFQSAPTAKVPASCHHGSTLQIAVWFWRPGALRLRARLFLTGRIQG